MLELLEIIFIARSRGQGSTLTVVEETRFDNLDLEVQQRGGTRMVHTN